MPDQDAGQSAAVGPLTLVTVMREPLAIAQRFVAWHLAAGFDRVVIYFDDPDDPAIGPLEATGQVQAVRCTPAFWAAIGTSAQERFVKRQINALTHGFRAVTEGWVAVADADELFCATGRPLRAVLADLPPEVRSVRVLPAEVVAVSGQEGSGRARFRTPFEGRGLSAVYGDAAWFVRKSRGMIGHREGKSLTRAGTRIARMRQHFPVRRGWKPLTDRVLGPQDGLVLLHFAAEDYATWRGKLDWRLASNGFRPRVAGRLSDLLSASPDPEAELRELYDRLFRLSPDRFALLGSLGGALELPDTFAEPVRRYFGGAAPAAGAK